MNPDDAFNYLIEYPRLMAASGASAESAFDYLINYPRLMVAAAPMIALLDPLLVERIILPMVATVECAQQPCAPHISRSTFKSRYPECRMNADQQQIAALARVGDCDVVVTTRGVYVYRGSRCVALAKLPMDPTRCIYFGAGLFAGCGQRRGSELTFRVCNYDSNCTIQFEQPLPGNAFAYKLCGDSTYCCKSSWVMFHPGFPDARLELKLDPLFDNWDSIAAVEILREIPCTEILDRRWE